MTGIRVTTGGLGRRAVIGRRARTTWHAVLLLLAGCSVLGPPPMEPLTTTTLATARRHWREHGSDAYHFVVRVRPPRTDPEVYDLVVAGGTLVKVERDGQELPPEEIAHADYSMAGIFDLLQTDLRWNAAPSVGDTPAIDLRAEFEPATGRLVRYRRTVGTERRRVLVVEVLAYEPAPSLQTAARAEP